MGKIIDEFYSHSFSSITITCPIIRRMSLSARNNCVPKSIFQVLKIPIECRPMIQCIFYDNWPPKVPIVDKKLLGGDVISINSFYFLNHALSVDNIAPNLLHLTRYKYDRSNLVFQENFLLLRSLLSKNHFNI